MLATANDCKILDPDSDHESDKSNISKDGNDESDKSNVLKEKNFKNLSEVSLNPSRKSLAAVGTLV